MEIKQTITESNIIGLVNEERRKINKISVSTMKQRQKAISHYRSVSWYHLLRGDVIKAFAMMQAHIDAKTMYNPDSNCQYLAARTPQFKYESDEDKQLRLLKRELDKRSEIEDFVKATLEKAEKAS